MIVDSLIIGGGIAGISAAARLSELGSVLLVEAETQLAYHASARSAALFLPNYGLPPVMALSRASEDFLRIEGGGFFSPRGLMLVGDGSDDDAFREEADSHALDPISPRDAFEIVPILSLDHVRKAAYSDRAWDIDTDRLIQHFARFARARGARLVTGHRVTAIGRAGGVWQVEAGGEIMEARTVINAAGAWADEVARMAGVAPLGIQPYRRSMARIPLPAEVDPATWPLFSGVGESWYAKPDAGALIVSPGDEDPMEPHDAWADDMVLAEGLARYQDFVTVPVSRLLASWAGLRSFAPDRLLVIGPDPDQPGFFWLAGQGGYGFQTAVGASQLLADLMAGRSPAIGATTSEQLSPARLR